MTSHISLVRRFFFAIAVTLGSCRPGFAGDIVVGDQLPSHDEPLTAEAAEAQLSELRLKGWRVTEVPVYSDRLHGLNTVHKKSPAMVLLSSRPDRRSDASVATAAGAVDFIRRQVLAGNGLPKSFDVPSGLTISDQVITEGINLYDSALAIWALLEAGKRSDAGAILAIYAGGKHGDMELRAIPTKENPNDYLPFNDNAYLLFDKARASAKWDSNWHQYDVQAGPNAWLVLAGARYLAGGQDDAVLSLIKKIGDGLLLLQSNPTIGDGRDHGDSQGGVRFGPIASSNGTAYDEISVENNLSAYAAFQALFKITNDGKYQNAARSIEKFLSDGRFYNPDTQQMQQGVLGSGFAQTGTRGGLFNVHIRYNAAQKRWELETRYASDSAGTWALSALGPDKIDQLFGPSVAQGIWATMRQNFGRTVEPGAGGPDVWVETTRSRPISGFDFSRDFQADAGQGYLSSVPQALIFPEQTAGAIFAAQQVKDQCARISSPYCLPQTQALDQSDIDSMRTFLSTHAGPYATGPGLTTSRAGRTGFGWTAPPASVTAMASVYSSFATDPLAWARLQPN